VRASAVAVVHVAVGWVPDISSEVVARALAVIETGAIGDVALADENDNQIIAITSKDNIRKAPTVF